MSWRFLLFCAAVIVILYGSASVVFSSGNPHQSAPGTSNPRTDQEVIGQWTPYPMSSSDMERCDIPSDAPNGSRYTCVIAELTNP